MLTIDPSGFRIKISQNIFTKNGTSINSQLAHKQHNQLNNILGSICIKTAELPDIVYAANTGLLLKGLPEKVVLLSNMKYVSRKQETIHIKKILNSIDIKTFYFPKDEPFEGEGECKWFYGGKLLLLGYGFRSNIKTVDCLQKVLNKIYNLYDITPPTVVGIHLINPKYYHLDISLCAVSDTECIIHKNATDDLPLLQKLLKINIIDTKDSFVLNLIPLKDKVVTHKLSSSKDKHFLQKIFQRPIIETDVSEFEKSGGSVKCLVLNI
jgi:N-dimethylarginine dimethylaminohydrolase